MDRIEFPNDYMQAIEKMVRMILDWKAEHQSEETLIQFNYQNKVMVIGTIQDGIEKNFISVNENGRKLIDKMRAELDQEPTCFMLGVAMDLVEQQKRK